MQTCLSCRAALREFRAAPERVAGVLPPAVLVASGVGGPLRSLLESSLASAQHKIEAVMGAAQTKTAAVGDRLHAAAELATGQKVAAVAASAAALAGGGTAIDELASHRAPPRAAQVRAEEPASRPVEAPVVPQETVTPPAPSSGDTQPEPTTAPSAPSPPPPPPPPDPANEFTPTAAPPPAPEPAPVPSSQESFGAAGDGAGGRSSPAGSREFAP
jgi:hypothetical protein